MGLSEAFYEAACAESEFQGESGFFSCLMVETFGGAKAMDEYETLMKPPESSYLSSNEVSFAANEVGWIKRDYRTFMLLMASEAVK